MRRLTVALLATLAVTLSASPATAAKPAIHACFGATIADHAMAGSFGTLVSGTAHLNRGVGAVVHAIQAGSFADADFPNRCND